LVPDTVSGPLVAHPISDQEAVATASGHGGIARLSYSAWRQGRICRDPWMPLFRESMLASSMSLPPKPAVHLESERGAPNKVPWRHGEESLVVRKRRFEDQSTWGSGITVAP